MEVTAYLLVTLIGAKLIVDAAHIPGIDFHSAHSPAAWIFWLLMVVCIAVGATGSKKKS